MCRKIIAGVVMTLIGGVFLQFSQCYASNLPSMNITLNGVTLDQINAGSKDIKYPGNKVDLISGGITQSFSDVEMKGRGNSTWLQPKKPYQIKFDSKVNLFNMGKAKKYILLANYLDDSNIRNNVAFYINNILQEGANFSPISQHLNLSVDDKYIGLYTLTTKNEIGSKRVNLQDPLGILVEVDNLHHTSSDKYIISNNGDYLVLNDNVDEQNADRSLRHFTASYNALEQALQEHDWNTVLSLVDINSFVNYYLVSEISVNTDAYVTSFFFYKDGDNDKIHAGPVWDFDLAFANNRWGNSINMSSRRLWSRDHEMRGNDPNISPLYQYLNDFPEFRTLVKNTFISKFANNYQQILNYIDTLSDSIQDDAIRNQQEWSRRDFNQSVTHIRSWLQDRMEYLKTIYTTSADITPGKYVIDGTRSVYNFSQHTDGSYTIYQNNTNQVLDVYAFNTNIDAPVEWVTYNGGTNQRWYLSKNKDGTYYIISKLTGLVINLNTMTMQEFDSNAGQNIALTAFNLDYILSHMTKPPKEKTEIKFTNDTHISGYGWIPETSDGEMIGTTGFNIPVEAFSMKLADGVDGGIEYRTHVQEKGWEPNYQADGAASGTTGKALQIEAIQMRLTGEIANDYNVYYRTHLSNVGWTDWVRNDEVSGTTGQNRAIEAIQVKIVSKSKVSYSSHVQDIGWMDWVDDGRQSGTVGRALQIEAIQIKLPDGFDGDINYRTHVERIGWMDWVKNGEIAGTTGQAKQMEAIEIKLSDNLANQYDIYYRAHVQDIGWMDWVKNGEVAGTTGQAKQVEAIEIRLQKK